MIKFKTVRFKNFLSTGNSWTEIILDRAPTTLVIGENGAGKSTMLDALCFGLFGKSFRKINKPQLINSINEKDCSVEIEFSIGSRDYKVFRGLKPAKFVVSCNGEEINQNAASKDYQDYFEKTVLKLNYRSFTQIVILGSSTFVPFMQLPAHARREIIEDLLDISIFSKMNVLLKEQVNDNKTDLQTNAVEIKSNDKELELIAEYQEKLQTQEKLLQEKRDKEISIIQKNIEEYQRKINEKNEKIDGLKEKSSDAKEITNKIEEYDKVIEKLEKKKRDYEKDIAFYTDTEECPKCGSEIQEQLRVSKIEEYTGYCDNLSQAISNADVVRQKAISRNEEIQEIVREGMQLSTEREELKWHLKSCKEQLQKLQEKPLDILTDSVDTDRIEQCEKLREQLKKQKEELINQKEVLGVASDLLKDKGIKTQIVKQYIPIMNMLVNKYLAAMEFFVKFELDENFSEVIKSRYRDEFSYSSFSEGEKMRIDLALLLTWRAIAKMKNSTNTNLLILDEVFDASLDSNGCDEFMKLLNEIGKETNVFCISHKGDQLQDKFYSVVKFEKIKNFSRMAA